MELTTRGSGPPPTFESLEHNELAPCSFCRLPLQDLGCSHLFCPRCKVFTRAPPVLQWETAGGRKALRAPVGSREARTLWPATHGPSRPAGFYDPLTAGQPNALAFAGCLTPTCSGNPLFQAEPRLTGPRFFPTMWGEPQELPEAPHSASGGHPVGPPRLFPWLGLNHLRRQPGQSFVPLLVRPHWPTSLRTAGPPPPPPALLARPTRSIPPSPAATPFRSIKHFWQDSSAASQRPATAGDEPVAPTELSSGLPPASSTLMPTSGEPEAAMRLSGSDGAPGRVTARLTGR